MPNTTFEILQVIGVLPIDEGAEIKISVDSFKNHKYISIRKYLKSDTYTGPTKAGITLSPEMIDKVCQTINALPDNVAEIEDKELGRFAKRKGLNIVLRVSSYMNVKGLDLRQYQEDSTYTGWTKKGIRLPLEKIKEIKELFTKTAQYFTENK
ncbi:MAG: transcriptional coactivator p15/PC4 family protein [Elusimicrobiaceae bacterium]|nr:transcriptional coactivator p15/PC4 family protein [Elusimicrobiaceae bacterium]